MQIKALMRYFTPIRFTKHETMTSISINEGKGNFHKLLMEMALPNIFWKTIEQQHLILKDIYYTNQQLGLLADYPISRSGLVPLFRDICSIFIALP